MVERRSIPSPVVVSIPSGNWSFQLLKRLVQQPIQAFQTFFNNPLLQNGQTHIDKDVKHESRGNVKKKKPKINGINFIIRAWLGSIFYG